MNNDWITAAHQLNQQGKAYVLVTLIGVAGSTPRDSGTKMVVTTEQIFDSIGGGHLEHKSIKFAHQLLLQGMDCQHLEHFQLGIHLDQCCGGNTNVLFECFAENKVNIMVFGAGHVGKALIPILASLPCQIHWVDSRVEQFEDDLCRFSNLKTVLSSSPEKQVAEMPANSYFIVLTHKHQMDFDISLAILKRDDYQYFGLIGSKGKWKRFQQRLKQREISEQQMQKVHCPIGLEQVSGKLPSEVAVSIASEVIGQYQELKSQGSSCKGTANQNGVQLKIVKNLLRQK